jgi:acylphosphatase
VRHSRDAGSAKVSYRVVIKGRVQGVSFRVSMRERALQHGLAGWVRNRSDGAVEALIHGEERQVARLIEWARSGPPGARVSSLVEERLNGQYHEDGFSILL